MLRRLKNYHPTNYDYNQQNNFVVLSNPTVQGPDAQKFLRSP